ncbi:hypothetical protein QWZ13_03630 [Reinekea marina]|uniref:hypothetical protein n=1 Tax=Reinekea marina TaxID=1310421 RepID=UPI0025B3AD40|nr:hypothetical protein [Reinekea marina]MDN3647971.1 hypothetical protein [Reinekea marina]MDN3647996.1 hypothetical protein [Reinekea marina]
MFVSLAACSYKLAAQWSSLHYAPKIPTSYLVHIPCFSADPSRGGCVVDLGYVSQGWRT